MMKLLDKIKLTLLPITLMAGTSCTEKKDLPPNIIYVFPDQMRNQALAFWSEAEYNPYVRWVADPVQTPNLNAFASESVVLSRAMSNCPLSSPYRGMFLTGMYPERSGITLNCMSDRPESSLREDAVCIGDVFKSQGYSCGYIGKLHADHPTKNDPENPGHYVSDIEPEWDAYTPAERRHGFDWWYSYGTFDVHKNPHYWDTDGKRHDPHEFSVKHETDKAIEYLRNENGQRRKDAPFFMVVAYNPPHNPYKSLDDCNEEDYLLYKDKSYKDLYLRPNADTLLAKAPSIRYYLANVTAVDREFGRILKELKDLGLDKNTIVVFTSDHGETMCSHSTPDPKNSIYTESFNVPMIIRYPEKIRHHVDTTLLSSVDIMPTLISMAGFGSAIPQSVEGKDLSSILMERKDEIKTPTSALYIRNLNGEVAPDNTVTGFFPQARGIKTWSHTMEITINRDRTLKKITIYDDINDPYQMSPIDYRENPALFNDLLEELKGKLEEANDIWYREHIISNLKY